MEPDPLNERLDTVMPLQEAEQFGAVVSEVPSSIDDILKALKAQPGISDAVLGRQVTHQPTLQSKPHFVRLAIFSINSGTPSL